MIAAPRCATVGMNSLSYQAWSPTTSAALRAEPKSPSEPTSAWNRSGYWVLGTAEGDWVSMSVPSDGSYGIAEGIITSFPCTTSGGEYSIVQGLEINEFSRGKIDASVAELLEEREAVRSLGLVG